MNKTHIGETVGIYAIVELMPYKHSDGHALYKGVCTECGFERIAKYSDLKRITNCTHIGVDGEIISKNKSWKNKRIQRIFSDMKQRCYNKNDKDYKWYGAKNIKIDKNWLHNPTLFEEWSLNNGYRDDLTIDRIDEDKDYEPNNCVWITRVNNAKYKSTTSIINVDGEEHTGKDWSLILGLGANRINTYIRKYGMDNTIEFIRRYKASKSLNKNLNLKNKRYIYELYMN